MNFNRVFIPQVVIAVVLGVSCILSHWVLFRDKIGVAIPSHSDARYYSDGAESIAEFDIEKKFNNKKYPIEGQKRPIVNGDMPNYAKYVLALYPNPSFKFGYSLVAALVTAPFPRSFFETFLSNLAFTNLLASIAVSILLGLIFYTYTKRMLPSLFPPLLTVVDVAAVHNNYNYYSHTMTGLFFVVAAWWIYVRSERLSGPRMALFAFLLSFSVMSSSHHVLIAVFFGILAFAIEFFGDRKIGERVRLILWASLGAFLPISYILLVESWFKFEQLGLPTFLGQLRNYQNIVSVLISTYPLRYRFIWDLRLWNIYIIPAVVVAVGYLIWVWRDLAAMARARTFWINFRTNLQAKQFKSAFAHIYINRKIGVPLVAFVAAFFCNGFYTQPLTRAMTPYTLGLTVIFASVICLPVKGRWHNWGQRLVLAFVGFLFIINYLQIWAILPQRSLSLGGEVVTLSDALAVHEMTEIFNHTRKVPEKRYRFYNRSISQFVTENRERFRNLDNPYIEIVGMDIVAVYTPMRRFTAAMLPDPSLKVAGDEIAADFRLLVEILDLQEKRQFQDGEFIRKRIWIWPYAMWDQEYNYIFGYQGRVRRFLKETPLKDIDPRYNYFVSFRALERLAE